MKETAEELREMDKEYDLWWQAHKKFGHSYKSFSHRKRSLEFAKYWGKQHANQGGKEEKEAGWIIIHNEGEIYHETLRDDAESSWHSFCLDDNLVELTTKEEAIDDGFECVKVERTYKIIEG